jgi:hypothetical protein
MKKTITLFVSMMLILSVTFKLSAQVPQALNYQAVARDVTGHLITNHLISIKIIIHQTYASGTIVYAETFTPSTNQFGLFTLAIGQGTPVTGTFSSINWSANSYWLQVEMDPTGGTTYTDMGTSQLLSVPYALYSQKAANSFSGDYNDLINQPTIPVNVSQLTNDVGYITNAMDGDTDSTNEIQNLQQVLLVGNNANGNAIINTGQIGIGTASPNSSAALDISSTNGALLLPRMTTAQRNALTPAAGMMVFNTDIQKFQGYTGPYSVSNYGNTSVNTGYGNGLGEDNGHHIFNAPANTAIDSIRIWISTGQSVVVTTLSVYNDKNSACGGNPANLGTSYSLTITPGAWNTFVFFTPVNVSVGSKYHIWSAAPLSIDGADNNPANTITDWYEAMPGDCLDNTFDRAMEIFTSTGGWVDLH